MFNHGEDTKTSILGVVVLILRIIHVMFFFCWLVLLAVQKTDRCGSHEIGEIKKPVLKKKGGSCLVGSDSTKMEAMLDIFIDIMYT